MRSPLLRAIFEGYIALLRALTFWLRTIPLRMAEASAAIYCWEAFLIVLLAFRSRAHWGREVRFIDISHLAKAWRHFGV